MHRLGRLSVILVFACVAPARAVVDASNVASLTLRWDLTTIGAVTGGPILKNGRLYVGTWASKVLAVDAATGAEIWSRAVAGPVTGRVLVTDDGRVCYGTLAAQVGCLDADTGAVQWTKLLGEPVVGTTTPADAVWSAPTTANGKLFVGIASQTDSPCIRGRLVALDITDGDELWRTYTIPEKVCTTDTSLACTGDGDCPDAGTCVAGRGAGVTATPTVDPTGDWVYMNTVGCYTYPSIGDSDSMFKIDASNGQIVWKTRVNQPEQFGACTGDTGVDCGVAADCATAGGTCAQKSQWHDFGFLNGPIRIELPGPTVRIVSASKNGTIYAFDETNGDVVASNVVRATPITPGFAGFGLFNGAITHANGRFYAALGSMYPVRVCSNDARVGCTDDAQCGGGTCPAERKHLMAFDETTLATVWEEEIGRSWSATTVANGLVFAGTNATDDDGASWLYAHDEATGARVATFPIPHESTSRVAIGEDAIYFGYGILSGGGLRAYGLCGNGTVDAGEDCDDGPAAENSCCTSACTFVAAGTPCAPDDDNVCTTDACDDAGTCVIAATGDGTACDDGDPCTSGQACAGQTCVGTHQGTGDFTCALDVVGATACEAPLPKGLARSMSKTIAGVKKLVVKAAELEAAGKPKAAKVRALAGKRMDAIAKQAAKAARSKKAARRISAGCQTTIQGAIDAWKSIYGLS